MTTKCKMFSRVVALLFVCIFIIIAYLHQQTRLSIALNAEEKDTQSRFEAIKQAIIIYKKHNACLPVVLMDLRVRPNESEMPKWNGPYLSPDPRDYWGREFIYYRTSTNSYYIKTYGTDGVDGKDDIEQFVNLSVKEIERE